MRIQLCFVAAATAVSAATLTACGAATPTSTSPAATAATTSLDPPAPTAQATAPVTASPSAAAAPVTTETTPEKMKSIEARRRLDDDRAKWESGNEAERARWTPELHRAAKALADATYPSGRAAIQAAAAGKHRKPGNAERDKARHPIDTLEVFGFKPTMTVLEVTPGEGWFTELLAPALAAKGKLWVTSPDPQGPEDQRSTFNGQRLRAFLEKAPEVFGKVRTLVVDEKAPALNVDAPIDLVLVMREVHGMVNNGVLAAWLREIHKALKPNGVLGIEEHRAPADANPIESAKNGYVPEKWLIDQVEAAGFKLSAKSEVNANPKDTKDYPEGVWALSPTFRRGDVDRTKLAAIGESDRMTLKFVKTARQSSGN